MFLLFVFIKIYVMVVFVVFVIILVLVLMGYFVCGKVFVEYKNFVNWFLMFLYMLILKMVLCFFKLIMLVVVIVLGIGFWLIDKIGSEFILLFDEGDLMYMLMIYVGILIGKVCELL